ncbi:hypothetical protein D9611_009825 [Ephemerocybe angulata]|uniref:Uncharacterized protein n=1 Tax=Ephemerocybe angulata TaxID=980116 RepID=A0A8H5CCJ9_9AGAR|nr:hypothetical protein D9611_009825 [Tulosesus angulatus]
MVRSLRDQRVSLQRGSSFSLAGSRYIASQRHNEGCTRTSSLRLEAFNDTLCSGCKESATGPRLPDRRATRLAHKLPRPHPRSNLDRRTPKNGFSQPTRMDMQRSRVRAHRLVIAINRPLNPFFRTPKNQEIRPFQTALSLSLPPCHQRALDKPLLHGVIPQKSKPCQTTSPVGRHVAAAQNREGNLTRFPELQKSKNPSRRLLQPAGNRNPGPTELREGDRKRCG